MIIRNIENKIAILSKQFPIIGIIGPRQCGKTTVVKQYQKISKNASIYLDLESPSDLRKISEPELLFTENSQTQFIIDEVQRIPTLFPILRSVVDKNKRAGRFILLGSASPDLMKGASESLAGRIYYIQAYPFNLSEINDKPKVQQKHWLRGGFPDAYLAKNDMAYFNWMDGFVHTFLEKDLNSLFGSTFSSQLMFKLWRMLAHHFGGLWNAHSFSKGLDVSPTTVNRYLDHLEGAFMVRKLLPYYTNIGKRLVKSPKIYIRDTGLLHYLLDISSYQNLQLHPVVGASWEGYVVEQICQLLPRTIQPYFYRTQDGSEIDLVLVKGIKTIVCIEIKLSTAPTITKGMTECIKDLKCNKNYIIIPSNEMEIPLRKNIYSCGLAHFLSITLPKLIK